MIEIFFTEPEEEEDESCENEDGDEFGK